MKSMILATAAIAALIAFAPASQALAQDAGPTIFGYSVKVGVKARVQPNYEGSDDYGFAPSGSFSLYKPGSPSFSAGDDGVSIALLSDERIQAGVSGRLRSGRDADDDDDLVGLSDIDRSVEVGGFINIWLTDWLRTRLDVRRGFGGHEGVVADLGADLVSEQDAWTFAIGPRFSYADDEYAQTYFGVTPAEALASPLIAAAYSPEGGPRYGGVQASAEYRWSENWTVTADASYRHLLGDFADSPLVRDLGDRNQYAASLGVKYAFGGR